LNSHLQEIWIDSPHCLGTREVLSIHKEKQKSGKIFEKWEMGNYYWRTFAKIDKRVNYRRSLVLYYKNIQKNDKIILFAETREEWMTTALACFKSCLPVVTVYATLGDEAVEYALREVDAKTVFTSEILLPKVSKAIKNGADVKNVIYFPSPDPATDHKHDDESVQMLSFEDLLNKGTVSFRNRTIYAKELTEDIAVIMYTSGTTGNPKGVMISHENILAAVAGQLAVIDIM
ncbi:hypothetical protein COOONC_27593, partial [Cooperia oncophora]